MLNGYDSPPMSVYMGPHSLKRDTIGHKAPMYPDMSVYMLFQLKFVDKSVYVGHLQLGRIRLADRTILPMYADISVYARIRDPFLS